MKYFLFAISLICIIGYSQSVAQTLCRPASVSQDSVIRSFCNDINADSIRELMLQMQAFGTRKANNANHRQVAQWIKDKFIAIGYVNTVLDSFTLPSYPSYGTQYNVIATLTGYQSPDSVYILGGHHDSYTSSAYTTAPGADDNASGTAGVIEVARVMKSRGYQPKSTIKFITFAAEEGPSPYLNGSNDYAEKALFDNIPIQMMINYDMISYCPDSSLYWKVMQYRYSNSQTVSDLGDTCRRKFTSLGLVITEDDVDFSDSYSFFDYGFKVAYFEEANQSNPYYHKTTDSVSHCNTRFAAEITKISLAMLMTENGTQTAVEISSQERLAKKFVLYPNYPNPFNPATTIKFDLEQSTNMTLKIYNTLGQEVCTLADGKQEAGSHQVIWNSRDNSGHAVGNGVYIYRLQAGSVVKSSKMLLIK